MAEKEPYPAQEEGGIKGAPTLPKGAPPSSQIPDSKLRAPTSGNVRNPVPSAYPGTVNQPLKSDNQRPASRSKR